MRGLKKEKYKVGHSGSVPNAINVNIYIEKETLSYDYCVF